MTFAAELKRAMTRRGITARALAPMIGLHENTISELRVGRHRPRPETATRLAEALGWPTLIQSAIEDRTKTCGICDRSFVDGTAHLGRRYCSDRCANAAHARIQRRVYQEGVRSREKLLGNRLRAIEAAVDAFCRDCTAGEAICRDDECALRPASTLPFIPLSRVSRRAA